MLRKKNLAKVEAAAVVRKTYKPPVAFEIVANPLPDDRYHRKIPRAKGGHYIDALRRLADAKRGSVLRFADKRCEHPVRAAAKKLGYEVWYTVDGDALLVQLMGTGDDK